MSVHTHQVVATNGAFEFLRELEGRPETTLPEIDLLAMMARVDIESPPSLLADLLAFNLLHRSGERVGITTFGIRTMLLLEAINGGDLREVFRKLGRYDSTLHRYELVREGMTEKFVESLVHRPGFGRLYLCSPWIRLNKRQAAMLTSAIIATEQRGDSPELIVITRPSDDDARTAPDGTRLLRELGATIYLNARLHTKLYIREPGRRGGYSMAIVGSQNLTKSQYLELGIRVNADSSMVNQLIAYFWELCNASREV